MFEYLIYYSETNRLPEILPEFIRKWKMESFSTKKVFLIYLSQMGKLTTMPAGLIYASVSVHAVKEEESKKQLVKPEQVICLQRFMNFV